MQRTIIIDAEEITIDTSGDKVVIEGNLSLKELKIFLILMYIYNLNQIRALMKFVINMIEIIELVLSAISILAIVAVIMIVLTWIIHIFNDNGK